MRVCTDASPNAYLNGVFDCNAYKGEWPAYCTVLFIPFYCKLRGIISQRRHFKTPHCNPSQLEYFWTFIFDKDSPRHTQNSCQEYRMEMCQLTRMQLTSLNEWFLGGILFSSNRHISAYTMWDDKRSDNPDSRIS